MSGGGASRDDDDEVLVPLLVVTDPDEEEWDLMDNPEERRSFEDEAAEMWALATGKVEEEVQENWFNFGLAARMVYVMLRRFEEEWRDRRVMEEVD